MATTEALVAHIWRRLGFGATRTELDAVVAAGPAAVIADLLGRAPVVPTAANPNPWGWPSATDYTAVDTTLARQMEVMAFGPNATGSGATSPAYSPLQERVAWILHGLVVIAIIDAVYFSDMKDHVTLLRSSTNGSYAQLLQNVSTRPGMLKYLTGNLNTKGHPNQNYARELMELFSLGRLNPLDGTANYTQTDVVEIARALTGWQYNWSTGATYFDPTQWDSGVKTFRGVSLGAAQLPQVITALTQHPSWTAFIPARFYRELTGLTATPAVLNAIGPAFGATGDLAALVAAITQRPEFLSDQAILSKTKSPVELVVSAARLLGLPIVSGGGNLGWQMTLLNQHPYQAPNVGGWFKGDQWLNATNLIRWCSMANSMALQGFNWAGTPVGTISPTAQQVFASASAATAPSYVLHLAGLDIASPNTMAKLSDYAASGSWSVGRAAGLLNLLLVSPEFLCC